MWTSWAPSNLHGTCEKPREGYIAGILALRLVPQAATCTERSSLLRRVMMGTSDAFSLPKILKDPERSWDVSPVCDQWLRGPLGAVGGWGVGGGGGWGRGGAGEWIIFVP